ncbi:hypothetical protein [Rhodococcoides fascians]|uniref:hypothetical protein n=1 Tax=Rhodococcoides fascians TaxID=1828 RepID=UPI00055C7D7C|nr:hypothetical protein [Rhodococcus fascians]
MHNIFNRCIGIDRNGPEIFVTIIEIIDYTLNDDGNLTATVITDVGDVIDIPATRILPAIDELAATIGGTKAA